RNYLRTSTGALRGFSTKPLRVLEKSVWKCTCCRVSLTSTIVPLSGVYATSCLAKRVGARQQPQTFSVKLWTVRVATEFGPDEQGYEAGAGHRRGGIDRIPCDRPAHRRGMARAGPG